MAAHNGAPPAILTPATQPAAALGNGRTLAEAVQKLESADIVPQLPTFEKREHGTANISGYSIHGEQVHSWRG
jgi:hypothetical protein